MMSKTDRLIFLDLPEDLANFDDAEVVVLSIPYEASTTYIKGTKEGPKAILQASSQVEFYDEELGLEPCRIGIATQEPFERFDQEPTGALQQIGAVCERLLRTNKFVVALGGEHTISVGLVRAFKKFHPNLWVLQLDAHSDLRNRYENSSFNHACTMARIGEFCPFVGVGIRSGIRDERTLISAPSKLVYAYEMNQSTNWQDDVLQTLGESVYLTIDLDFFDPAVMSSVGTPEPGGFNWFETIDFLRKVIHSRKIVGFDVVELSPQPGSIASDFFAAKLVYKLLGLIFEDKLRRLNRKEKS